MAQDGFETAVQHMKQAHNLSISNEDKLKLYALFKQATAGDCATPEPSRFNLVANSKWRAHSELRGMKRESAKKEYVNLVQSLDSSFVFQEQPQEENVDKTTTRENKTEMKSAGEKILMEDTAVIAKTEAFPFYPSLAFSLSVSGAGVVGFLVTTLSNQALFFLSMVFAGLAGAVMSFVLLLRSNGLIALYPALVQRILLDRTLVEVILEGTIMQRVKDFITEVYPIIYCKTHEDRLAVLENMSEKTRKLMTTRGVVNLLPEWQQKITLSEQEYQHQKAKRADEVTAFRPALDASLGGQKKRSPTKAELDAQRKLAAKFFRRSLQDRLAQWILKSVNPNLCKNASFALAGVFVLQLQLSARARKSVKLFFQQNALRASSLGSILFGLVALLHLVSKRYSAHRRLNNKSHQ